MICHICNKDFNSKKSLSNHLIKHPEFAQEQINLICKLSAQGYTAIEIQQHENVFYGIGWINRTMKKNQKLLNEFKNEIKNDIVNQFKNLKSSKDIKKQYNNLSLHTILCYIRESLSIDEIKQITYKIISNKNKERNKLCTQKILKPKNVFYAVGICKTCGAEFIITTNYKQRSYCSRRCSSINAGKVSANSQNKRSKNEIYFSELCNNIFKNVLCNERLFNGWDADIIIEDYKIAILWNGIWHYKQISHKHSILQVQTRDKLKIKEIEECGYHPYVIKDMGKHNKKFVEEQFNIFLLKLLTKTMV